MRIQTYMLILILNFGCLGQSKNTNPTPLNSDFIDSTRFKYFGLEEFDIQDWHEEKVELKTLTQKEAHKYYQHRLRPNTDFEGYHRFYSLQKNQQDIKIITIIDGATGNYPDLRLLIYNEKDSLIGFYPIAGLGNDPNFGWKYKVTSKRINDTIYISTRVQEYGSVSGTKGALKDSTVTKFVVRLGYMMEDEIIEKKVFKIKNQ